MQELSGRANERGSQVICLKHDWSPWETFLKMINDNDPSSLVVTHEERHCYKCGKVEKRAV